MESFYVYDLVKSWRKEKKDHLNCFYYPQEGDFFDNGFVKKHSGAADLMDYAGIFLKLCNTAEEDVICTAYFADREPLSTVVPVRKGTQAEIKVRWSDFPVETARENTWQFVTGFSVETQAEIKNFQIRRRDGVYAEFEVRGKAAKPGETVVYQGSIHNCAGETLMLEAKQIYEGWESVNADIYFSMEGEKDHLQRVKLEAGKSCRMAVLFRVHDYMVPGGHEDTIVEIRAQGTKSYRERVVFQTLRYLPHPYIYHNKEGFRQIKEKIEKYAVFQPAWNEYVKAAEEWVVEKPFEEKPYCYLTETENQIMSAAYCYAITGEIRYAEKIAAFFRYFTDEVHGYPAKLRGCSQSYVQEGHFFQHLAIPYDIIYESGVLSEKDHKKIEQTFRLYMNTLDRHIRSGRISNWQISEIQGALYCSLALQDMNMAERFVFGRGGNLEQFTKGIFNDGWWHECSVGYNTWVSSMMLHMGHAMRPFGYDLIHTKFPVPFNKEVQSTYAVEEAAVQFGMYNQKWGGNQKISVGFQDMFDATLQFLDERGVIFGIADSDEKKLGGVHFGSTYDLAYYYYRDERYLPVIRRAEYKDPIFGDPKLLAESQTQETAVLARGAYADNIGIAMLRSHKNDRKNSEEIQAVLRYGSHGGAHGHFDICDLLSVMRYGRSFFNPENCWWGYAHFMYKFYVQCSLTKNMVTVDEKMQLPADSKRTLFVSNDQYSAGGVEVNAKWCYPPYGGMVYEQDGQTNTREELKKRCQMNRCYLPIVEENEPVYGEMSAYTEAIRQKRIMVVRPDYIVLFDAMWGEQPHTYDSLMQIKGLKEIEGNIAFLKHTEQMNDNPISDAQFITDCNWYQAHGATKAKFETIFTEEMAGERKVCDRSNYNNPGVLKMDVHTAWPQSTEQMTGRVAIYHGWAADGDGYTIPVAYRVEGDGKVLSEGAFDAWILGRGECDVSVDGVQTLRLCVRNGDSQDEVGRKVRTPQALFWGEAYLLTKDGTRISLTELAYRTENIDTGMGIGKDYCGGRVTIVGTEYPKAIPASTVDHSKEGYIEVDISALGAERFVACIGCDAFPGDEGQTRMTYAVRTRGKDARFITVIEPYEAEAMVRHVEATDENTVVITLADGKKERIAVHEMDNDGNYIEFS